ncbi:hypothetical protein [Rhodococcus sp. NPDC049939]|uniref:hypothetical protein n=1 Tax=Rhodococcus sp. NPDC049939 TaxID=3155511 RepID=UPI0033C44D1B
MAVPFPWGKHLKRTSGLPVGASDVIMLVVALIPALLLAVAGSWLAALGVGIFGMIPALSVMAAHANTRTKVLSSRVRSVDVDPRTGRVRAADQSAPPAPGAVRGVIFPHSWIRVLTLLCLGAFMLLIPWWFGTPFRDPVTGSWGIVSYVIGGITALPALATIAVAVATVQGGRYGITVVADGILVSNPLFARMIPWQQIAWVRPTRNREGRIPVDMIRLDFAPGARSVRLPSGMLGRLTMLFVPQTRSKIELPFQHFDIDPVLMLNLLYDLHTQPPLRAEIVDGRIFEYLRSMLAQPR